MGKSRAERIEEKDRKKNRLLKAIERDDVDELHNLIVEEPGLLDLVSNSPFPNTPLHIAAAAGKTNIAMELAILRPSFARKLNPEGYSPMHLALQYEHYHTVRALMYHDPKLIRVPGRCGITALHYVAGKEGDNELELLHEFLRICKSSIEDLTSQCETALHVAIKNHNLKAFNSLFGWLYQVDMIKISEQKDKDDYTVLQIAKIKLQQHDDEQQLLDEQRLHDEQQHKLKQIIELYRIIHRWADYKNADNEESSSSRGRLPYLPEFLHLSSLEKCAIATFEKCADFFRIQKEAPREVILIVSTLIVAATYQATLTPPVVYWQDSSSHPSANSTVVTANSSSIALGKPHQAEDVILNRWRLFLYFICNSMAFYASIATILATTLPLEATSIVYISIPFLCTAYFISLSIQIPIPNAVAVISTGVLFELSMLAVVWLLLYMKIQHSRVQPFNPRIRSVPTFLGSKN